MISSGQTTNSPSVPLCQMAILCRAETLFVSHSKKFLQNSFYCNSLTRMITAGNSGQKQSWCEWALLGPALLLVSTAFPGGGLEVQFTSPGIQSTGNRGVLTSLRSIQPGVFLCVIIPPQQEHFHCK